MQAKAKGCREALAALLDAVRCYGGFRHRVELLCVEGRECHEILAVSPAAAAVARKLLETGTEVFALGIHAARYCKGRLYLLLGLLNLINIDSHFAVTSQHGEKLFLYGRDLFEESVKVLALNEACARAGVPVVVVSPKGFPLGFARYQRKGRIILANLIDAGWYLRSGV